MVTPKSFPPPAEAFAWMQQAGVFFPFVVVESPQPKLRTQFGVLSGHRVRARSRPLRAARRWTEGSPKHAAFSRASRAFTVVPEARVLVVCCVRRVQTKGCRWAKAAAAPLQICNRYGVLPEGGCCILVPRVATGGRGW